MKTISSLCRMAKLLIKKIFFEIMIVSLVFAFSIPTMAGVDAGVSISVPPPIVFAAPPEVIVIPGTYVYVVPDVDEDIFFYDGWWWRQWQGVWYRSQYYDSGWGYYQRVPSFYVQIPSGWRSDYRDHSWGGRTWNYQRIPHQQVQQNWRIWKKSRHWEKQQTWGVQGLKPGMRSQQPSHAVQPKAQAKPQVQKAAKPQRSSQMVKPKAQAKPKVQKAAKPQKAKPQAGKPEKGEKENGMESKI